MLKSGEEYKSSLNDGRKIFVGGHRVEDVTTSPYFSAVIDTIAKTYDEKRTIQIAEAPEPLQESFYYKIPKSFGELKERSSLHDTLASKSFGMLGRPIDYVPSFLCGIASKPELLGEHASSFLDYFNFCKKTDLFLSHAVVPMRNSRVLDDIKNSRLGNQNCRVEQINDDGIVVSGMKMLATSAAISNEIWVGNLIPLDPAAKKEAVTFSVPCNAPGLSIWVRTPFTRYPESSSPLCNSFDEPDSVLVFDKVKIDWNRVFVLNNVELCRDIYFKSPAHCLANHQSLVRYKNKLKFITSLASLVVDSDGRRDNLYAQESLGKLASAFAVISASISGQVNEWESWDNGVVSYNRPMMYGALQWCCDEHLKHIELLKQLSGSGSLQMPADESITDSQETRDIFNELWATNSSSALRNLRLQKLVWDIVGSDFAGRQNHYESFFAGGNFVLAKHNFREADWMGINQFANQFLECLMSEKAN